jgi:hypothetical protein
MGQRVNYYAGLAADYSRPGLVPAETRRQLIRDAERFLALKEPTLPPVSDAYPAEQIARENREWWPTHCEALRQGRGDLLTGEYRDDLVYLCQDGPFHGLGQQTAREAHWWTLIARPGVTTVWPVVQLHGEVVFFEWKCLDDVTGETTAEGNATFLRRGHRGGCYLKTEHLTFYRDVFASDELLRHVRT